MNYYEHHLGDYDGATAHLSWLEDCAYRRLICLYYRTESPIPADVKQACRLVRAVTKQERDAVQQVLAEFFKLEADGWHHDRCDAEVVRYRERSQKARDSVSKRWANRTASALPTQYERNTNVLPTQCEGNALQTPDTIHQTPDVLETSAGKRRKRLPADFYPDATGVSAAERAGLSLGAELQRFRDHHAAKGTVMLDWQAAFRTWVNNAQRFSGGTRQSAQAKTISDLTGGLASVKGGGHALRIA